MKLKVKQLVKVTSECCDEFLHKTDVCRIVYIDSNIYVINLRTNRRYGFRFESSLIPISNQLEFSFMGD